MSKILELREKRAKACSPDRAAHSGEAESRAGAATGGKRELMDF